MLIELEDVVLENYLVGIISFKMRWSVLFSFYLKFYRNVRFL